MHSSYFYNKQTYEAVVVKDKDFDGLVYYYAYYKEYKSIKGTGNDESVAIADLKKAFKSCLIEILKDNEKIIEPKKEVSDKTKNYAITIKENIMQKIDIVVKNLVFQGLHFWLFVLKRLCKIFFSHEKCYRLIIFLNM